MSINLQQEAIEQLQRLHRAATDAAADLDRWPRDSDPEQHRKFLGVMDSVPPHRMREITRAALVQRAQADAIRDCLLLIDGGREGPGDPSTVLMAIRTKLVAAQTAGTDI